MGILLDSVQDILKDLKKYKFKRGYHAYVTHVLSMQNGIIQAVLENRTDTPTTKNIRVMQTLVEAQLVEDLLFDNIYEGSIIHNKTFICGLEFDL